MRAPSFFTQTIGIAAICFLVIAACSQSNMRLAKDEQLPEIVKNHKSLFLNAKRVGLVNTGVYIEKNELYTILATGTIDMWPGHGQGSRKYKPEDGWPIMARFGKDGYAFEPIPKFKNSDTLYNHNVSGELYMGYRSGSVDSRGNPKNPTVYEDDTGGFTVDVIVWKEEDYAQIYDFLKEMSERNPQNSALADALKYFQEIKEKKAQTDGLTPPEVSSTGTAADQEPNAKPETGLPTKKIEPTEEQPDVFGTRWAVVVGISKYKDTRIPSLRYASKDAQSFYNWLLSLTGGKYAPARVKLLIDEQATGNRIKKSLFEWLGQVLEEDIVTIFFAGHGSPQSPDNPENLFLLPYDVQYDSIAATGFPMWDIETALKRFIKAKRVIVIADACHAGGVGQAFDVARRDGRGVNIVPISSILQNLSHIGDGICILTASDDDQFSQESKMWGGGHGVFTYYLLKGLNGNADYNKDSVVSLGEIIPYLSEQVRRETRNAQSPTVAGRFDPALTIGK